MYPQNISSVGHLRESPTCNILSILGFNEIQWGQLPQERVAPFRPKQSGGILKDGWDSVRFQAHDFDKATSTRSLLLRELMQPSLTFWVFVSCLRLPLLALGAHFIYNSFDNLFRYCHHLFINQTIINPFSAYLLRLKLHPASQETMFFSGSSAKTLACCSSSAWSAWGKYLGVQNTTIINRG